MHPLERIYHRENERVCAMRARFAAQLTTDMEQRRRSERLAEWHEARLQADMIRHPVTGGVSSLGIRL